MEKDPRIPLHDIIDSCDRSIANVNGVDVERFRTDINLQDAVIRRFEIIGEAVKRVPDALRAQYPDVFVERSRRFPRRAHTRLSGDSRRSSVFHRQRTSADVQGSDSRHTRRACVISLVHFSHYEGEAETNDYLAYRIPF